MRGPVNQVVEGNSPFTELQLLHAYSNAKRPLIPTDGGQDSN
jgi:hypothetical protein